MSTRSTRARIIDECINSLTKEKSLDEALAIEVIISKYIESVNGIEGGGLFTEPLLEEDPMFVQIREKLSHFFGN
jgi:hypothetical protein